MRTNLLSIATILAMTPGLLLYLQPGGSAQTLGIFFLVMASLMVPVSFVTASIGRIVWFLLFMSLIVMSLSYGYVTIALSVSLGIDPQISDLVALSVLALELSIIVSNLFETHKKHTLELRNAGYETEEFETELNGFIRLVLLLAGGTAALSVGIYFLFSFLPQLQIDSLSVLVISAVIYFAIARYVLKRRHLSVPAHMAEQ